MVGYNGHVVLLFQDEKLTIEYNDIERPDVLLTETFTPGDSGTLQHSIVSVCRECTGPWKHPCRSLNRMNSRLPSPAEEHRFSERNRVVPHFKVRGKRVFKTPAEHAVQYTKNRSGFSPRSQRLGFSQSYLLTKRLSVSLPAAAESWE